MTLTTTFIFFNYKQFVQFFHRLYYTLWGVGFVSFFLSILNFVFSIGLHLFTFIWIFAAIHVLVYLIFSVCFVVYIYIIYLLEYMVWMYFYSLNVEYYHCRNGELHFIQNISIIFVNTTFNNELKLITHKTCSVLLYLQFKSFYIISKIKIYTSLLWWTVTFSCLFLFEFTIEYIWFHIIFSCWCFVILTNPIAISFKFKFSILM